MKNKAKITIAVGTIAAGTIIGQLFVPNATPFHRLVWEHDDNPETIDYFYVITKGANGLVLSNNSKEKQIWLTNILGGRSFGMYTSTVTAVGMSRLASDPSDPLAYKWYGDKPTASRNFNVKE